MTVRVAALLTSHNRAALTVACLKALEGQRGIAAEVGVVLCDAGSTDGTVSAVRERFPSATVLEGTPDLFWNAGMRRSFEFAVRANYDFYMWLNDDTVLDPYALSTLFGTLEAPIVRTRLPAIVVGAVRDPSTGTPTYGGVTRFQRFRPMRFAAVLPGNAPVEVETMNGNCVLIPRDVVEAVGLLDPGFSHGMGDFDYGFRARRAGVSIWLSPGTVGQCARNPAVPPAASFREHVRSIRDPKGLPPREWARFVRRWAGPLWPVYAVTPLARRTRVWARARLRRE